MIYFQAVNLEKSSYCA